MTTKIFFNIVPLSKLIAPLFLFTDSHTLVTENERKKKTNSNNNERTNT